MRTISTVGEPKSAPPKQLTLERVRKQFNGVPALHEISLSVQPGELVSLLGPSGCGKTTTLRLIAGFEFPDDGTVRIDGQDVSHLPPNKRGLGMVFQNYSLFPHLTVSQNIGFGLKMAGASKATIDAEVARMLDMIRLQGYGDRHISQLSGGQQQRIALARAIVTNPSVLLLDEPLGALDKNLREGMQLEIRRMQQSLGITSVMVTHDQEEAMIMSDRIVVMNQGRILQIGRPADVYDRPSTRFVAEFLGTANILAARLERASDRHLTLSLSRQDADHAHVSAASPHHVLQVVADEAPARLSRDGSVQIAVRPEKMRFGPLPADAGVTLEGIVREHIFRGSVHTCRIEVPALGTVLTANQPTEGTTSAPYGAGEAVTVSFRHEAAVLLQSDAQTANDQGPETLGTLQRKAA